MEVRVLGALEVRDDGGWTVQLGAPKQRALLAILLLHANEVVSRDRLIDDLWGERAPDTATTALQVYVSKLRKVLPPGMLVTRPPGYALELEPDLLDARRFERLVGEGREELGAGRAREAAARLREAFALWRGPPLAEFAFERFAEAEIARLEELRLVALEERVEADLRLGRHAELVGELEALVAAYPLRERARGQLMLALYRSGRQAEALEAYQDARRALVDGLGIEPSGELQQLERAILQQDVALAPPPPVEPAVATAPAATPERKLATVLFADLGATGASGDPEVAEAFAERVVEAALEEIEAAGGTAERGIAGALLATFGAPSAQEDHVERGLAAATAVRERLRELFGDRVDPRFALESGEVVSTRGRIAGTPVAEAARLVRDARAGEIVVGARAAGAARGGAGLDAKGVRVAVDGREWALGRTFVGRGSELDLLARALERVLDGREAGLVSVVGDAGIGKSTLVGELRARTGDAAAWLVGRCLSYGRALTYRPLADVLRARLALPEDAAPEEVIAHLAGREILGLTLGLDVAGDVHPREARERLDDAWVALLEEAARERPLVLLIEDLHWAEEPLLELLERLARDVPGPLLVLATARPELFDRAPGWGGRAARVFLEPLSRSDVEQLLDEVAGPVPAPARELVVAGAEGNPFFAEELLRGLIDRGTLQLGGDGWTSGELPDDTGVPDSVQAVLAARLDLLAAAEKRVLQAGSVIGRTFSEAAVRELGRSEDADLRLLEERGFVRRAPGAGGERAWAFRHALTREVAYRSLPAARRARLHASLAGWLERLGGSRDEDAPIIAHHYAEAARPELADLAWAGDEAGAAHVRERAVTWLRRAAALAASAYELEQALALYDRALSLATDDATAIELWREVARVHGLRGDPESVRRSLEAGLALEPDPGVAGEIYARLAEYGLGRPYMWRQPPPRDTAEGWLQRALELTDRGTVARARALAVRALAAPAEGAGSASEALRIAERGGDGNVLLGALEASTAVATAARDHALARRWADRGVEVATSDDAIDPDMRAHAHWNAGFVYLRGGEVGSARRFVDVYERLAADLSVHDRVHAVGLRSLVEGVAGGWETLRGLAERAEELVQANEETPCQFNWRTLLVCALGAAHVGDAREARRLEERGRATAVVAGPPEREPALLRLALVRGELDEAARILQLLPTEGDPWGVDAPGARLDALAALGDRERVEAEAEPYVEEESLTRPYALRALAVVRGDRDLLVRALERFEAMGLAWEAEQTRTRM